MNTVTAFFRNNYYIRRIWIFFALYFAIELIEVAAIIWRDGHLMDWSLHAILEMSWDFFEEAFVAMLHWMIPFLLYLMVLPRTWHLKKTDRILTTIFLVLFAGINVFEEVAEYLFWDEFSSRFNFIAVDYLIYTKEVIGNIQQSYPLVAITSLVLAATAAITFFCRSFLFPKLEAPAFKRRAAWFGGLIALCTASFFAVDIKDAEESPNRYNNELSKNGFYSLFSAFLNNELEYEDFYITCDTNDAARFLRRELDQEDASFGSDGDSIRRTITPKGSPIKANVMVVIMESMGSEFLNERREDGLNITPCLSALAREGIFFPNTYATGTRSVRGLEAVSTAMPPLPGMSIVRRRGNEHIQTIGSIFRERHYETKWIYGGYGVFDNMNNFYQSNGFEIVDRTSIDAADITHTTIWGVCDEDLFYQAIREADKSHHAAKSFLNVVFTTSNHRPYTYPEGKIDIPSKTGRLGAVKYADYAVGQFIEEAKSHPWFDNTIFVFVADHGAGSAGKKELNPETHLIPLIIYAPGLIAPERYDYPISQIDTLPTLLGLMKFPYSASFYGKDARLPSYKPRYFISNYQHVGYAEGDVMVVLKPMREVTYYIGDQKADETEALKAVRDRAVFYYRHASDWRTHLKLPRQKP